LGTFLRSLRLISQNEKNEFHFKELVMNLKRISVFFLLLLMVALVACQASPVAAGGGQPQVRTLSVNGNGKVYLTPDVAYINIGVQSQSESVSDALNENSRKAQAIADALKELGVEEKDIQTSAFNIYPQQQYDPDGKMIGILYIVDNTVNVTVRDLTVLGKLLDAAVRAGANNIYGITFDVVDKTKAITEARQLAAADARRQAEELANAAGVKLSAVQNISSYVSSRPAPLYDAKGGAAAMGQVPISAGQMVISVDVNITYEIQ
jgi:uncharacterized protein YggE